MTDEKERTSDSKIRCGWAGAKPYMIRYHDEEWGRPVHDDLRHFEMLVLEGAQAGLSWDTILRRRDAYRQAFAGFDPSKVARFDSKKKTALLKDSGIIRNRLKIDSAVTNARAFLTVQREFGSFDRYVWSFVGGKPKVNHWTALSQVPATSEESDALSKDLKQRGFRFVGSTIIYAHMQSVGMVNDHLTSCFVRTAGVPMTGRKRRTTG
jgi:DNA-3-methyladenine glycosylase I